MSDLNDPAYWLERADQARRIAKSFAYERACTQMIVLAEGYEQMARMAEEMKLVIRDGASPFVSRPSVNQSIRSGALLRPVATAYRLAGADASPVEERRQMSR
jgi:hypothetical protein